MNSCVLTLSLAAAARLCGLGTGNHAVEDSQPRSTKLNLHSSGPRYLEHRWKTYIGSAYLQRVIHSYISGSNVFQPSSSKLWPVRLGEKWAGIDCGTRRLGSAGLALSNELSCNGTPHNSTTRNFLRRNESTELLLILRPIPAPPANSKIHIRRRILHFPPAIS